MNKTTKRRRILDRLHRFIQLVPCFIGVHKIETNVDYFIGCADNKPVTIGWENCNVCGHSKLIFIYGDPKPNAK